MSNSPPNYMDEIPVKISEKFKPPPKITLPQSMLAKLAQTELLSSRGNCYDFDLEEKVIRRINEWKNVRERERYDRQERIRAKNHTRLKQIEDEQKQKLNEISYPNTDDLSSSEDEEPKVSNPVSTSSPDQQFSTPTGHFSPLNKFDSILTPTILPESSVLKESLISNQSYLDINIPKTNIKTNFHKINYSDFENDTSSPFDNMELVAMNEIDILAQVLNLNSPATVTNNGSDNKCNENVEVEEKGRTNEVINHQTATNYQQQQLQQQQQQQQQPQQQQQQYQSCVTSTQSEVNSNEYYKHYSNYYNYNQYAPNPTNIVPTSNYNNLNDNYINHHSTYQQQQQQHQPNYHNQNNYDCYYNQPRTHNYAQNFGYSQPNYNTYNQVAAPNVSNLQTSEQRSKSKSVPDIVKQLSDEIKDSELKRTRNNSQTIANSENEENSACSVIKPAPFSSLSASSQNLANRISSMGFPLERVSKIVNKLGNDDKKIVEHLIPLGELLVLGFDENKISDALIKFGNNKDKALDYLIS